MKASTAQPEHHAIHSNYTLRLTSLEAAGQREAGQPSF